MPKNDIPSLSDQAKKTELYHWIGLALTEGVGSIRFFRLIDAFGSATHVFSASYHDLCQIIPAAIAKKIKADLPYAQIEKQLNWAAAAPQRTLLFPPRAAYFTAATYPSLLQELADPPVLLYTVGQLSLLENPCLAVVGSRQCTQEGRQSAYSFAQHLSEQGLSIVSGLALGIDTAAHQGGLCGYGQSIAVLPTSLDKIYPAQNKTLAVTLAKTGLLISEIPIGVNFPIERNFSRRNRLISGLSIGVLVIEAKIKSGSLSTAHHAVDQNRDVFAVPGSIYSDLSTGCHQLIQMGAKLVMHPEDVLNELNLSHSFLTNLSDFSKNDAKLQQQKIQKSKRTIDSQTKIQDINNAISLQLFGSAQENQSSLAESTIVKDPVLHVLKRFKQLDLDRLCEETGLTVSVLSSHLLGLELDGKIQSAAGFYKIL